MAHSGWTFAPLADCCTFVSGGTPPKDQATYWQGDIPWVSPKDMNVRFVQDAEDHISPEGVKVGSRLVPKNTVLIVVRSMTLANRVQIAITERAVAFNQDLKALLCQDNIEPRYLFYALLAQAHTLLQVVDEASHGTKRLRTEVLGELEIPLPPLSEQQAIGQVLGMIDDKIELNLRMNNTLENLAQAFFASWFVDFDPVYAKAAGQQPTGIGAETAALFADGFDESRLGPIPHGWHVAKVSTVLSIGREGLSPGDWPGETFDHYSIPAYDEGCVPKADAGALIKSNKSIVTSDSVLISKLNPHIPRVWLPAVSTQRRSVCSTEFLVTRPVDPISRAYLYTLLSSNSFLDVFGTLVTGTSGSHQRVQPESLLDLAIVLPPDALIQRFTRLAQPLYERVAHNLYESRILGATRDALLPKLLTGEIRVAEAEKILETAP